MLEHAAGERRGGDQVDAQVVLAAVDGRLRIGRAKRAVDLVRIFLRVAPSLEQLIANSKQVLGQLPGMGDVEIKIVLDPPWTPDKMTQDARDQLGIF